MALIKPLRIGPLTSANNTMLAPMAGITDTPLRILCLKGGAGIVCAEMVSATALTYGSEKSKRMLRADKKEHPLSMQIFGSDAQTIARAARLAQDAGADIVDINAGCPVKKINKAGAGCVLMKDPAHLAGLIEAAVKAVKIPVTLKTRIGLKKDKFLGAELARVAQDAGASAVIMHARWAEDMHAGQPHLDYLAQAANAVNIPVIGNGGVNTAADAYEMLQRGCAGVMVGRGALGNPYIFKEIAQGKTTPQDWREKLRIYLDLIKESVAFYGTDLAVKRCRKTAGFWINNFDGASRARAEFMKLESAAEIENLFEEILDTEPK